MTSDKESGLQQPKAHKTSVLKILRQADFPLQKEENYLQKKKKVWMQRPEMFLQLSGFVSTN